jgi:hypothetical protein
MTEKAAVSKKKKDDASTTSCFTYEVSMVIQVIASDRASADDKLEKEGGYVSRRDVVLKDVSYLYDGSDKD